MIEFVRKRKKGIVNFILLGLAVILMISFGVESFAPSRYQREVAITLNGEEIPRMEFDRRLRSMEQLYQNQFREVFEKIRGSLNLPQKIADQMIDERLLSEFFDELKLTASLTQVEARIGQLPFFNGKVDADSFRAYLRGTGLSEAALEQSIRKEVVEGEFQNLLAHLSAPTERELRRIAALKNEEARFLSAKFPVSKFSPTITESEVSGYYQENSAKFTEPKGVDIEFVRLSPEFFLNNVQVTDEDLHSLYESRKEEFREEEELNLSRITFQLAEENTEENATQSTISPNDQKRKTAQSIIDRVKKGEPFQKLAQELAENDSEKNSGGALGWKKRTDFNDDILAGIENLNPGEVSGLVEDANTVSVFFLNEKKESRTKPFEEVKEELKKAAQIADAPLYLDIESERILDELRSGKGTLADVAARFNTQKREALHASKGELSEEIRRDALIHEEGEFGKKEDGPTLVLYQVKKLIPEHQKPLEEVRAEIEAQLKRQKARELARTEMTALLQKVSEKGGDRKAFEELFKGAALQETEPKKRADLSAPFIDSPERTGELFALTAKSPLFKTPLLVGDEVYAVMLTEKKESTSSPDATLLLQEAKASGARAVDALVQLLRRESSIEVNPAILETNEL